MFLWFYDFQFLLNKSIRNSLAAHGSPTPCHRKGSRRFLAEACLAYGRDGFIGGKSCQIHEWLPRGHHITKKGNPAKNITMELVQNKHIIEPCNWIYTSHPWFWKIFSRYLEVCLRVFMHDTLQTNRSISGYGSKWCDSPSQKNVKNTTLHQGIIALPNPRKVSL